MAPLPCPLARHLGTDLRVRRRAAPRGELFAAGDFQRWKMQICTFVLVQLCGLADSYKISTSEDLSSHLHAFNIDR